LEVIFVASVQSNISGVGVGKKKRTENVAVIIPDVVDEDTVIAIDDDIASVHTTGIHSAVDASSVTAEV